MDNAFPSSQSRATNPKLPHAAFRSTPVSNIAVKREKKPNREGSQMSRAESGAVGGGERRGSASDSDSTGGAWQAKRFPAWLPPLITSAPTARGDGLRHGRGDGDFPYTDFVVPPQVRYGSLLAPGPRSSHLRRRRMPRVHGTPIHGTRCIAMRNGWRNESKLHRASLR